jgi:hypothetical protein
MNRPYVSTDKKENKIFLIYKEIQMGSGAKSYMRKDFLIYEEIHTQIFSPYMRRPLIIYDFAPDPSEFPNTYIYEESFLFFFIIRASGTVVLCQLRKFVHYTLAL